jgi:NADH-quinone oxidoreductase subunit L
MQLLPILLIVFPLLGFLLLGLTQKLMSKSTAGILASSVIFINLVIATVLFNFVSSNNETITTFLFNWINVGSLNIPFEFVVDRLSALMLLIINGVGLMIHIYSIGYMKEDEANNRFFSYLNLFVFFMLILVLSSNYLVLFIGWEGVGLSSYLLIGFWFKDHANNDAAKKAFIYNRIGDLGFLIAMFLLYSNFHSLSISEIAAKASSLEIGNPTLMVITLCLFVGATGKSAQIPLFTWLPDAMAGPTPVSALIHAATMVTAGIYLIARSSVLFVLSPITLNIILIIGTTTAIVAGLIAIYQNDIKKILAYSTVSQLGFLFMAVGLGSFTGAMFHLFTHAFFKALLFLAAGSVIHALNNEQDIRKMGGLRKKIPATFALFVIGTIAISGLPPFAGFFSKELILGVAYQHSLTMGLVATLVSLLTSIYMFRLLFVVFFKPESDAVKANHHVHESPKTMLLPMGILAFFSIVVGFINLPALFSENHQFESYLSPIFALSSKLVPSSHESVASLSEEWSILLLPLLIIVSIILFSYKRFVNQNALQTASGLSRVLADKFYFDEIYDFIIVKPSILISNFFRTIVDQSILNSFIDSIGSSTLLVGNYVRRLQSGNTGLYVLLMVFSIITVLFLNIIF